MAHAGHRAIARSEYQAGRPTGSFRSDRAIAASVYYALAVLKWLDDMDKHALVRPSFIGPERVTLHAYWHGGDPAREESMWEQLYEPFVDPLEHGTQLYRAQLIHGPGTSVPMTIEPDVNFGLPLDFPWVTLNSVRASFTWVRRIIMSFRRNTPEFRQPRRVALRDA